MISPPRRKGAQLALKHLPRYTQALGGYAGGANFPDENFAREIMQLFTVGLWKLNSDGTQQRDQNGEPIPTYNQALT